MKHKQRRIYRSHGQSLRSRRGAASVLIILLLVLLVFFGVLALVTAATEWRMAVRRAEWSAGYYQADSKAQRMLALIGQICQQQVVISADPSEQAVLLATALSAEIGVTGLAVTTADEQLRVEARIVETGTEQGIDLIVLVLPADSAGQAPQIKIMRWSWWRAPFDYDRHPGGIWEG